MNRILQQQWMGDIYMEYSIEIIYFDDESYMHKLYLGYGINAIRKVMPLANLSTRFIDKNTCGIDRVDRFDIVVIFCRLADTKYFMNFANRYRMVRRQLCVIMFPHILDEIY